MRDVKRFLALVVGHALGSYAGEFLVTVSTIKQYYESPSATRLSHFIAVLSVSPLAFPTLIVSVLAYCLSQHESPFSVLSSTYWTAIAVYVLVFVISLRHC